jgi:hypothetical protein
MAFYSFKKVCSQSSMKQETKILFFLKFIPQQSISPAKTEKQQHVPKIEKGR